MRISTQELVALLRTQGDHALADRVAAALPDEIDTDRDRDLLARAGLDGTRLSAHLAAAAIHPIG